MAAVIGQSSNSSQRSDSALDPQIRDAFLKNYSTVQDVSSKLPAQTFAPQTGQYFAGTGTVDNAAATANRLQNSSPMFITGQSYDPTFSGSTGYSPVTGTAAQLNGADINNYLNPFTSAVTNTTLSDLNRAREMSLVDNSSNATRSGAYGGTRQAVADSLTNESFGRTAATTLANLNKTNYDSAVTAAQADVANRQQTGQANLGYGNTAAQFGAGAANTAALTNAGASNTSAAFNANSANTANLANQSAYMQNLQLQLQAAGLGNTIGSNQANLGMTSTAYNQSILDAQRNLPLQQIALNNQALGLNPGGGAGTVSSGTAGSRAGSGLLGFNGLFS